MNTNTNAFRFLLVEDDDDHAYAVERGLRKSGINCVIARSKDGAEALDYLRVTEDVPDLILLDLKLPKKSGHEVLEAVKTDEELRTIPVVVLTTSNAESDRIRAYRQYANSYVIKPVDAASSAAML